MTSPKNGNSTRWTIGVLVSIAIVLGVGVAGWTRTNAQDISKVSERAAVLDANMKNLKDDVAEIKIDVKRILARMPG